MTDPQTPTTTLDPGDSLRSRGRTEGVTRALLIGMTGAVAVTAFGGGVALILGAIVPSLATILSPPVSFLAGSPFSSFLVPGIVLGAVVGGTHLAAAVLLLRRTPRRYLVTVVAAYAVLIWIFVQMIFIPFSFLQAAYFAAGLGELGLVLLALGVMRRHPAATTSRRR